MYDDAKAKPFIKLLLCVSLFLNVGIFYDFLATPQGNAVAFGYSMGRLILLGCYVLVLVAHIFLIRYTPLFFVKSPWVFGVLTVVILYGCAENVFRYHGFGLITPAQVYRGQYWFAHQPNKTWHYSGGNFYSPQEFSVSIRNNSKGYHDREHVAGKQPAYRIVLLGDSFVEAYQVDLKSTFHTHLEKQLRQMGHPVVDVVAIGLSGMGFFWQVDTMLDDVVAYYEPNLVISQYASWFVGRDAGRFNAKKTARLSDTDRNESVSYVTRLYQNPITHALIWRNLSNTIGFVLYRSALLLDRTLATPPVSKERIDEKDRQTLAKTCVLYRDTQEKLGRLNIDLLVAIYPSKEAIAYYRNSDDKKPLAVMYEEMIEACLAQNSISTVNLSRSFAGMDSISADQFYFRYDGHWNVIGHQAGAMVVADFLNARKQQ